MKTLSKDFETFRKNRFSQTAERLAKNEKAKADFKAGLITENQFYKDFHFEKTAYRLEFFTIINNRGGKTEFGKICKLDGSYSWVSDITYYGESLLTCYKKRYYLADGSSVVIYPTSTDYMTAAEYKGEKIEGDTNKRMLAVLSLLYDMEGIEMLMQTKKHKRILSCFLSVIEYRLNKEWVKKAFEIVKNIRQFEYA